MKKSIFTSMIFTVLFVFIWSPTFLNLDSYGIGIGVFAGIVFFLIGILVFKKLDRKGKHDEDKS